MFRVWTHSPIWTICMHSFTSFFLVFFGFFWLFFSIFTVFFSNSVWPGFTAVIPRDRHWAKRPPNTLPRPRMPDQRTYLCVDPASIWKHVFFGVSCDAIVSGRTTSQTSQKTWPQEWNSWGQVSGLRVARACCGAKAPGRRAPFWSDPLRAKALRRCAPLIESCHAWMCHVSRECAMSHMITACHSWMRHVTYMSRMNGQCHICMSHVTSRMNASRHIWIGHVTCEGIGHVTYEWVKSHMNASCHMSMRHITYEWVVSHMTASCHVWMGRFTREWVHVKYKWATSHMTEFCHIRMGRVTYEYVMSHSTMGWLRLVDSLKF